MSGGTAWTTEGQRGGRLLIAVLFAANFLSFFDRSLMAAVLEPVRHEFALDDATLGLLGAAFTIVYAIASLPVGSLIDRVSRKQLLASSVIVWSGFTAATGAAMGILGLFAARIGVGIGEASCTPAATSMIGDLVRPERRGRVFGLFMLGFPIGSFAALAAGGALAEQFGWRTAFFLAAAAGVFVAAALLVVREPVRAVPPADAPPVGWRAILASGPFWCISLASVALGMSAYALGTYLPAFFARSHGTGLGVAGLAAAMVLGGSGLVGLTAGGALADRMAVGRRHGRALLGMVGCLLAAPLILAGLLTGSLPVAVTLLALGWMLYFLYFVTAHTTLIDEFDARLRGRVMGLFALVSNVLGGTIGSVAAGALSDRFAAAALLRGLPEAGAKALGLQQALAWFVPGGLLIAAGGYAGAALLIRAREGRILPRVTK